MTREKLIQYLHNLARASRSAHGGKRTNIHEHHRDDLLHAAKPRIAREDLLRCLFPNVQTEGAPKALLFTEFVDHMIEFADEQPEFVDAHQGNVKVKTSPRHSLGCVAQIVDWLHDQPADQDRCAETECDPDAADEYGKPLRIAFWRWWRKIQQEQRANRADSRRDCPKHSAGAQGKCHSSRREIGSRPAKKHRKQSPLTRQLDEKKAVR